ncbi:Signal transduction histidine kinase [Saccharicrinis carchari]|uniref:histidine kinase n=1 Tax=Saccharicrinis carchari TaxID=1168039 RepID=A0A521CFM2_SACCC|nr:ATP-binding protein [Saccharicrinis carchari]SMO58234.1 Signal transduction histidine kinase [Saccharicrinis carchari]
MSHTYNEFTQQLNAVSAKIDAYLSADNRSVEELEYLESWLFNQSEKVRLSKLNNAGCETNTHVENQKVSYDAIIICDAQLVIHRFSGPSYYFPGAPNSNNFKFGMDDLMSIADRQILQSAVNKAKRILTNQVVDLYFTTPDCVQSSCQFEIDAKASNFGANRVVIFLTFKNNREQELANYQRIMLDNLPGMDVYLFDKNFCYIMVGGKEKERFNLSNNEMIGKTLFEVVDKKSQRSLFPFYHKAINGEASEGEVRFKNELYFLVAKPIKDRNNNTVAGILIVQNVTQDKELEERLKQAKIDAQNANKAKSIFIANMSHEIRTPLNAIVGFTEQLKKTKLNTEQQHHLSLIEKASDQLLYLVTEIVFLFKLGMGRVYIEKIPFSLSELIQDIYEICSIEAKGKSLDFIVDKEQGLPDTLIGDPHRLRQILMNLLINAIKYTDKGSVKLFCNLVSDSKKSLALSFTVSDTGRGIAKKDLPHIFDVFEQGTKRTQNLRGGAGLGLGISKKLCELLDATISVQSKLNVGSDFKLVIPFKKASTKPKADKGKKFELQDKHLKNKTILLADDDEHSLLLGSTILKSWGAYCVQVKDGQEALTALQKKRFDVVLLDINMPKKTGVQVIKKMRSNAEELNHKTPTLCITANAITSDIKKNLKVGFDDYLIKPFGETELYNKLCNALSIDLPMPKTIAIQTDEVAENCNYDFFDTSELLKTAEGDRTFFNKMIANFIKNADSLAQCIHDNLDTGEWETIGESVHKAIPSFKYFGMNKIASNFELIEDITLSNKEHENLSDIVQQALGDIYKTIEQAKAAIK